MADAGLEGLNGFRAGTSAFRGDQDGQILVPHSARCCIHGLPGTTWISSVQNDESEAITTQSEKWNPEDFLFHDRYTAVGQQGTDDENIERRGVVERHDPSGTLSEIDRALHLQPDSADPQHDLAPGPDGPCAKSVVHFPSRQSCDQDDARDVETTKGPAQKMLS